METIERIQRQTQDERDTYTTNRFEVMVSHQTPRQVIYVSSGDSSANNVHRLAVARALHRANLLYLELAQTGPGRIKILCENEQQAKAIIESDLPKSKGWKTETPTARNFRYGIVRNLDEEITEEDIIQDFESEQRIVEAQRQKRREGDKWVDSNTWRLKFEGTSLPYRVESFGEIFRVSPYVFPVLQCKKCQRVGHPTRFCKGRERCPKCAQDAHGSSPCTGGKSCGICGDSSHSTLEKDKCNKWKREREIKREMAVQNMSYAQVVASRREASNWQRVSSYQVTKEGAMRNSQPPLKNPTRKANIGTAEIAWKRSRTRYTHRERQLLFRPFTRHFSGRCCEISSGLSPKCVRTSWCEECSERSRGRQRNGSKRWRTNLTPYWTSMAPTTRTNSANRPVLKILHWNARSLRNKIPELRETLRQERIDIALIQEAQLPENSNLIGEYVVVTNPVNNGRNTVILVHRSIHFRMETPDPQPRAGLAETVTISIPERANILWITNTYVFPGGDYIPTDTWNSVFSGRRAILAGDLNAHSEKWDRGTPQDRRGVGVSDWAEEEEAVIANSGEPTRIGNIRQRNTAPDVAILAGSLAMNFVWKVLENSMGSDHLPCVLAVQTGQEEHIQKRFSTRKWNIGRADWKKYREDVRASLLASPTNPADTFTLLSECYSVLIEALQEAMKKQRLERRLNPRRGRHRPQPWWNEECTTAIKNRANAFRAFRRRSTPESLRHYKEISRQTSTTIQEIRAQGWKRFTASLTSRIGLQSVWRMARRYASRDAQIRGSCEDWSGDFLRLFTPDSAEEEPPVWKEDHTHQQVGIFDSDITSTELEKALAQSGAISAPGLDGITYMMLAELPEIGKKWLKQMFNRIWRGETIPTQWNGFVLIPIPKSGKDPEQATSYRPIALASCVRKTFQRSIKARLEWWAETSRLLDEFQNGFRAERSVEDNTDLLTALAYTAFNKNQMVSAFFADVKGAYDNVPILQLITHLRSLGCPNKVNKLIFQFLTDRRAHVFIREPLSEQRRTSTGLPQGDILAPLLYIIYTSDVAKRLPPHTKALQYADDICLLTVGPDMMEVRRRTERAANQLDSLIASKGMPLAPAKSQWMIFTRRKIAPSPPDIVVRGEPVSCSGGAKFLGLFPNEVATAHHRDHEKGQEKS